jgi:hypothetical protein
MFTKTVRRSLMKNNQQNYIVFLVSNNSEYIDIFTFLINHGKVLVSLPKIFFLQILTFYHLEQKNSVCHVPPPPPPYGEICATPSARRASLSELESNCQKVAYSEFKNFDIFLAKIL